MKDLNLILNMKPSELKIYFSVKRYDEKTAEKLRILLRCRKAHDFQAIKDINPKFDNTNLRLK